MKEVLITSGTSFEGYDIVGYGTYKFTQTILNSNFLKDFGTSIADIATDRRDIYQEFSRRTALSSGCLSGEDR